MRVCDRCRATSTNVYELRLYGSPNIVPIFTKDHELCPSCREWVKQELVSLSDRIIDSNLANHNYVITHPPGKTFDGTELRSNISIAKEIVLSLYEGKSVHVINEGWKIMAKQPDGTWVNIGGGDENRDIDKYLDSHEFPFECRTVLASQYMECKYCGKSLGEIKELKLSCPSMKSTRGK